MMNALADGWYEKALQFVVACHENAIAKQVAAGSSLCIIIIIIIMHTAFVLQSSTFLSVFASLRLGNNLHLQHGYSLWRLLWYGAYEFYSEYVMLPMAATMPWSPAWMLLLQRIKLQKSASWKLNFNPSTTRHKLPTFSSAPRGIVRIHSSHWLWTLTTSAGLEGLGGRTQLI